MNNNYIKRYFDDSSINYKEKRSAGLLSFLVNKEISSVLDVLNVNINESILDAGCGDGKYSNEIKLAGGIPYGVDISELMIEKYLTHGFNGEVADISNLETEHKFDKILCAGSIEFSESPKLSILNLRNLLKADGSIVWLFPRNNIFGFLYKMYHSYFNNIEIYLFSKSNINGIATNANLVISEYRIADIVTGVVKLSSKSV